MISIRIDIYYFFKRSENTLCLSIYRNRYLMLALSIWLRHKDSDIYNYRYLILALI